MTVIRRAPFLFVQFDGVPTQTRFQARASHGLDQQTALASVRCPGSLSMDVGLWSRVTLIMGANVDSARTRFVGYVAGFDTTLYAPDVVVQCKGALLKTDFTYGSGQDFGGDTDIELVEAVLTASGIASSEMSIDGLGETLGSTVEDDNDTRFTWTEEKSGRQLFSPLDEVSQGYRTLDTPSGRIVRAFHTTVPGAEWDFRLQEYVDIVDGSGTVELVLPKNKIIAEGWNGVTHTSSAPNDTIGSGHGFATQTIQSDLIESADSGGDGISAEDVADYFLGEYNRTLIKVSVTTPRDDLLEAGMTIAIVAPETLEVDQVFWLQNVVTEIDEHGVFSQTVTAVSDLGAPATDGGTTRNRPHRPGGGRPTIPPPVTPPPTAGSLEASFAVLQIEKELAVIADAEVVLYVVSCEDTTVPRQGTIVTRAWTTSAGATITTGSGTTFVTAFTAADFPTATITLTVTDSLSNTAATTVAPATSGASAARSRKLYTAATAAIEAFDGTQWRVVAPSADSAVVANGPLWGAGEMSVVSADDLATATTEVQAFGSGIDVTALWVEVDVSTTRLAAGGANGHVATSADNGATWADHAGPTSDPVLKVILSRDNQSVIFAMTEAGWYQSIDNGATWSDPSAEGGVGRLAASGQAFRDMTLSHSRNVVASQITGDGAPLERAEAPGDAFTFPSLSPPVTDVVMVFAHIREDRFACIDAQGRTFVTQDPGGWAMVRTTDLPTAPGTNPPRGGYRDGAIPGLLYYAADADGCWKSLDFFGSADGFVQLRKAGVGNAGSGPWLMIGAGDLALPAETTTTPPVDPPPDCGSGQAKFFVLWTQPDPKFGTMYALLADNTWNERGSQTTPGSGGGHGIGSMSGYRCWSDDSNHVWSASDWGIWMSTTGGCYLDTYSDPPSFPHVESTGTAQSRTRAYVFGGIREASIPLVRISEDNGATWTGIVYASDDDQQVYALACGLTHIWMIQTTGPLKEPDLYTMNFDGTSQVNVTDLPDGFFHADRIYQIYASQFSDDHAIGFDNHGNVWKIGNNEANVENWGAVDGISSGWGVYANSADGVTWIAYAQSSTSPYPAKMLKSTDGGEHWATTWSNASPGFFMSNYGPPVYSTDAPGEWIMFNPGGSSILHSVDDGGRWEELAAPEGTVGHALAWAGVVRES